MKAENIEVPRYRLLFVLLIFVFVVWAGLGIGPYWVSHNMPDLTTKGLDKFGQLGDSFGMVNALFSGLAFAAIIFALHLQRKEFAAQLHDLKATQDAHSETTSAIRDQITVMKRQNELAEAQQALEESQLTLAARSTALSVYQAKIAAMTPLLVAYEALYQDAIGKNVQQQSVAHARAKYSSLRETMIRDLSGILSSLNSMDSLHGFEVK